MITLPGVEIFSTCPSSLGVDLNSYAEQAVNVACWSEAAGLAGMLIYTDNGIVDPWLMAELVIHHTSRLRPLVAVQPVYMHPYAAAKMVSTLGVLHGRRVYLNMLAGGFKNDLVALNDGTPHDERYARTVEYTLIIRQLLESSAPVTFEGTYYRVLNLKMTPPLPPELFPGILISGSSEAGLAAARMIGATAVKYPKPPGEETDQRGETGSGVRVGIIARATDEEAWKVAHDRFPGDRKGQIAHAMAMKVSDSEWHRQLSGLAKTQSSEGNPYWLWPFENYRTFCPYLVGSYQRVGAELSRYVELGFRTVILDIPVSEDDLDHTGLACAEVNAKAAR